MAGGALLVGADSDHLLGPRDCGTHFAGLPLGEGARAVLSTRCSLYAYVDRRDGKLGTKYGGPSGRSTLKPGSKSLRRRPGKIASPHARACFPGLRPTPFPCTR